MLLLGLDIESSGLSPTEDSILEIGLAHWDVERRKPVRLLNTYVKPPLPIPQSKWDEILPINGITQDDVEKYGRTQLDVLKTVDAWIRQADAVVAHNGTMFDKLFIQNLYDRNFTASGHTVPETPWIDTRLDLPEPMTGQLICIAAKHGFLNPFPHQALSDVLTMLKILDTYDIAKVIERAKIPSILVVAKNLPFDRKEEAKSEGFYWRPDSKTWVKTIKDCDLAELKKKLPFKIEVTN